MYTESDPKYMHRALELAARALLHATPNPRVGCVVVREGEILGEGFTQPPGGNHAELEALQDARRRGHDVGGATAYVTLEPCSHFGRTPPCATALIEARIGRVVAAVEDPNPLVAGRGMEMLRSAGIDVRCGLLRSEAIEANNGFFSRMNRGRPWVRVKLAASLDGRTSLENGHSRWITGDVARADGHAWRARACGVLTGIGTVRADDPLLTVREVATPRQPLKVLADSAFALDEGARWIDGNPAIVFTARGDTAKSARLIDRNVQTVNCAGEGGRVDLSQMLRELAGRGVNELHVEAGATLSGALVGAGLVDEILLYVAPMLVGRGRGLVELPPLEDLAQAHRFRLREAMPVGDDLRILVRSL